MRIVIINVHNPEVNLLVIWWWKVLKVKSICKLKNTGKENHQEQEHSSAYNLQDMKTMQVQNMKLYTYIIMLWDEFF